jgi:hypothetical protein
MPSSSEATRLDRLEKKEVVLEAEIGRLDKEEKDLERRLTELELKEIELAKSVSRLTQVKARRPEFLMNYMKLAKKHALASEAAPVPIPNPAPIPFQSPVRSHAPETKPAPVIPQVPAPKVPEVKPVAAPAPEAKIAQVTPEAKPAVVTPEPEAAPSPPAQPKPAPEVAPVPGSPAPPQGPQAPGPEVKPAAASTQALLAEAPAPTPPDLKVEEKSERKQIHEAQIKNVLKKQEIKKIEEQQKQEVLDAKAPIRELKLDGKMSESAELFKLLLSKGVMTLEEAGKILQADKGTVLSAAKDLEDSGLIEVNKPLYGSPKIRLKNLSERIKDAMDKPPEKK